VVVADVAAPAVAPAAPSEGEGEGLGDGWELDALLGAGAVSCGALFEFEVVSEELAALVVEAVVEAEFDESDLSDPFDLSVVSAVCDAFFLSVLSAGDCWEVEVETEVDEVEAEDDGEVDELADAGAISVLLVLSDLSDPFDP